MICSHWVVPDRETADLVADFMTQVTQQLANRGTADYARALQAAKIDLIRNGAGPKAWAPLVLIGPPTGSQSAAGDAELTARN